MELLRRPQNPLTHEITRVHIQAYNQPDIQLHELHHKLQFLKAQEFKEAKAVGDVHDVIENLKYKVGIDEAQLVGRLNLAGDGEGTRVVVVEDQPVQEASHQLPNTAKRTIEKSFFL